MSELSKKKIELVFNKKLSKTEKDENDSLMVRLYEEQRQATRFEIHGSKGREATVMCVLSVGLENLTQKSSDTGKNQKTGYFSFCIGWIVLLDSLYRSTPRSLMLLDGAASSETSTSKHSAIQKHNSQPSLFAHL